MCLVLIGTGDKGKGRPIQINAPSFRRAAKLESRGGLYWVSIKVLLSVKA